MNLRDYQVEAVEKAMQHDGFALFMEQRTGKTPTAIEIVRRRRPARLLIVCPKVAVGVWRRHLSAARLRTLTQIRTYATMWRDRKRLRRWAPEMMIVDESHQIKNHQSRQSKGVRYVSRHARYRLALTGTPIDDGIEQAWAQFDFVDPSLFGSWAAFKARYLVYGGYGGYEIVERVRVPEFRRKIETLSFRVQLDDVAPQRAVQTHTIVHVPLTDSAEAYAQMEKEFRVNLFGPKEIVAPRVITQALKMHQITAGFITDEFAQVHRIGYEKAEHLAALMMRLGNIPTVIMCRFLEDMAVCAAICQVLERTYAYVSGAHKFQGFDTDVIIVQVQSGIAIDLSRAQHTIFYSMDYSFLKYDQARFRIRAYDSTEAHYYYLIGIDTIDVDIYEAVRNKLSFSSYLINRHRGGRMAVRKKVLQSVASSDSIDLAPELKKVRSSITTFIDGDADMATKKPAASKKPATAEAADEPKVKKKPAKAAAAEPATKSKAKGGKKAASAPAEAPAPAGKKKAKPAAAEGDENLVTLATLAAELKVDPRAARRKLRTKFADSHEGKARWAWPAGSKELDQVREALSA